MLHSRTTGSSFQKRFFPGVWKSDLALSTRGLVHMATQEGHPYMFPFLLSRTMFHTPEHNLGSRTTKRGGEGGESINVFFLHILFYF